MNGNGRDGQISNKQEKGVSALLTCPSIAEAARKSGIGETTLRRWMKEPDFAEAYRQARKQVAEQAAARIQLAMGEAVETLRAVMNDSDAPASARVSAARAILETAFKAIEQEEIEQRLQALENQILIGKWGQGDS